MSRINQLREKRQSILNKLDEMTKTADKEKREFDQEESNKFDKLFADSENIKSDIQREEKREALQREMAQQASSSNNNSSEDSNNAEARNKKIIESFRSWVASGQESQEIRALQADSDTQGGYLVAPEQFVMQLIKAVDDVVSIRRIANVFSVPNADSLGAASLDNDPDDADWTSEIATGSEDGSMSFGKRELKPHPVAKRIKVSKSLLRKSMMNVESIVMERLAYKFGVTEEKAFLTGNGSQQPLGIFVASNNGIPTSRDVSSQNTTTSVSADGLINAEMSLKDQHRAKSTWIFHRDGIKQIRQLKDGEGRYLLDLKNGTINGIPFVTSEYAPNTFTTGQYVGIIGNFEYYWIADALDMEMQRLNELYAETNQVGFIGRKETDGMPVLAEAFARVKLA
ncbi:MAG: phage major capsid protein [Rickettsiales bacterium]|nr:phage major capsid protein [Pseudomonadota bacterium]MDA0966875.1 phage major capsid protein [Pseudomonadota bacterium]MDG4543550.1 phage major capsid protein [Rickettsiales bacterium]MDG4545698.1 phage major capsid protein [Rickettsiales bacterium]MDG4547529.1 phage major capsid protein [Rickettsiales bacterium]